MRKNFGSNPFMYPMPVLIIGTYNEDGTANAMNAAWGGISAQNKITICVSPGHKTMENIKAKKAFTVSMADVDHVVEADFVGVVSGNKVDNKLDKAGLHTFKSELVDAPIIEEFPFTLECKLDRYDDESKLLFGEIVNVSADERILDENGKVDLAKLKPITFDPVRHGYHVVGEKVGNAFSDGNKLK